MPKAGRHAGPRLRGLAKSRPPPATRRSDSTALAPLWRRPHYRRSQRGRSGLSIHLADEVQSPIALGQPLRSLPSASLADSADAGWLPGECLGFTNAQVWFRLRARLPASRFHSETILSSAASGYVPSYVRVKSPVHPVALNRGSPPLLRASRQRVSPVLAPASASANTCLRSPPAIFQPVEPVLAPGSLDSSALATSAANRQSCRVTWFPRDCRLRLRRGPG